MTDDTQPSDATIYMAPNIRDQALGVLNARADQRRDRRMLAAFEVHQTKQKKMIIARAKDIEKFARLMASAEKRLQQTLELLNKIDDDLRLAAQMHNQAKLMDQELGDNG